MLADAFAGTGVVRRPPAAGYDALVASRGLQLQPGRDLKPDAVEAAILGEDLPVEDRGRFDAATVDAARLARRFVELKEAVTIRHAAIAELKAHETVVRSITSIEATLASGYSTPSSTPIIDLAAMQDLVERYALLRRTAFAALYYAVDDRVAAMTAQLSKLTDEVQVLHAILTVAHQALRPADEEIADPAGARRKTCPICFDQEVDTCCVPCGHTLCATCSDRSARSGDATWRCSTCRTVVRETVKLFFSA